jgi:hypothetical protein
MRESRTYGFVRGAHSDMRPYRDPYLLLPLADNAELTQRQGQAYSQRSESPRFREESLHLGMRAAVDQVL